jgi:predicted ArsR family transcriptional regulator
MRYGITHRKFLEALLLCPAGLTAEQVARLLGSPTSVTYYRTIARDLVENGFVQKAHLARISQHGRLPAVFQLTRKGYRELERNGIAADHWYAPSEAGALSDLFRQHALVVGDTLIALTKFAQQHGDTVRVERVLHERDLRRLSLLVPKPSGGEQRVVSDLFTELQIHRPDGTRRRNILWEIDRATERQRQVRAKVSALVALLTTHFEAAFGSRAALFAFVATQGNDHAARLARWTEHVLRDELGREDLGALFRFTGQAPAAVTPEQFLAAPTWYVPFRTERIPLIEGFTG